MESHEAHWAANLFPMMAEAELQELAEDIRTNGLISPIVLDANNLVVDGRNREKACSIAGVEATYERLNGTDPLAYVVSANVKRRNLNVSQRAMAAAEAWIQAEAAGRVAARGNAGRTKSGKIPDLITGAREHFAKLFSSNAKYVDMAKALLEDDPVAAREVKAGNAKLTDKYEELRLRVGDQDNERIRLNKLRATRPDLAEQVENGELDLEAAERLVKEEAEKHKQLCWAVTNNLLDAVEKLDRDDDMDHVHEYLKCYSPELAQQRGVVLDAKRLRRVADFSIALALMMEGESADDAQD